jgi:hypothetical protein
MPLVTHGALRRNASDTVVLRLVAEVHEQGLPARVIAMTILNR